MCAVEHIKYARLEAHQECFLTTNIIHLKRINFECCLWQCNDQILYFIRIIMNSYYGCPIASTPVELLNKIQEELVLLLALLRERKGDSPMDRQAFMDNYCTANWMKPLVRLTW